MHIDHFAVKNYRCFVSQSIFDAHMHLSSIFHFSFSHLVLCGFLTDCVVLIIKSR